MAYVVIKAFTDLQDKNYSYEEGKPYPREGVSVLPSRIKELASSNNRRGVPLIKEVEEPKTEETKAEEPKAEENKKEKKSKTDEKSGE